MKKLLLLLIFPLLTTGCWDRIELEEQAYVIVIGIDKGINNMFSVTYQIPATDIPSASKEKQGAEGHGAQSSEIITLSAPDFLTARELATASVTRKINFSHTRVLVISEEVARSEEVFRAILGSVRDREFRRNVYLVISKEKASDFIHGNSPKLESSPHKFYDYISKRWGEAGLVPISTISDYLERLELKSSLLLTPYGTALPPQPKKFGYESNYLPGEIEKEGGNPIQIIGSAVFKEKTMVGSLTGEETRMALLLSTYSKADNILITFPDPLDNTKRVTFRLFKDGAPKIKVDVKGKVPSITVKSQLNLKLLAIPSAINYIDNPKNQQILKSAFESYMETKLLTLVKKTQEELKGDPFQWSLAARRQFGSLQDFLDYNWMEKYPKAKVDVIVNMEILGSGKQLTPPGK